MIQIEIEISSDALTDLRNGFFYEKQAGGLGDYFSTQIRSDIDGLQITAGI